MSRQPRSFGATLSAVLFYGLLIVLHGIGIVFAWGMFVFAMWEYSIAGLTAGVVVLGLIGLVLLLLPVIAIRHQIRWMRRRRGSP